jgi:hypothetical protein
MHACGMDHPIETPVFADDRRDTVAHRTSVGDVDGTVIQNSMISRERCQRFLLRNRQRTAADQHDAYTICAGERVRGE